MVLGELRRWVVSSFRCTLSAGQLGCGTHPETRTRRFTEAMEVFGKSMVAVPTNVIFLSSILGQDGPNPVHKCDWKCENEHVCGNMYRCRLTGLTHICDKNCNQRILYDNHSSLCRVSKQIFPFTPAEEQAVKGVYGGSLMLIVHPLTAALLSAGGMQHSIHHRLRDLSPLLVPYVAKLEMEWT